MQIKQQIAEKRLKHYSENNYIFWLQDLPWNQFLNPWNKTHNFKERVKCCLQQNRKHNNKKQETLEHFSLKHNRSQTMQRSTAVFRCRLFCLFLCFIVAFSGLLCFLFCCCFAHCCDLRVTVVFTSVDVTRTSSTTLLRFVDWTLFLIMPASYCGSHRPSTDPL